MTTVETRLRRLEKHSATAEVDWIEISHREYDKLAELRLMMVLNGLEARETDETPMDAKQAASFRAELKALCDSAAATVEANPYWKHEGEWRPGIGRRFFITRQRFDKLPTEEDCQLAMQIAEEGRGSYLLNHWYGKYYEQREQ